MLITTDLQLALGRTLQAAEHFAWEWCNNITTNVRLTLESFPTDFTGECIRLCMLQHVKIHAILRRTRILTTVMWTSM